jgi:hypothetical protein
MCPKNGLLNSGTSLVVGRQYKMAAKKTYAAMPRLRLLMDFLEIC